MEYAFEPSLEIGYYLSAVRQAAFDRATYNEELTNRFRDLIRNKVGRATPYIPNREKPLHVPLPRAYTGTDDLEVFDEWLSALLRWLVIQRRVGPDYDEDRILAIGTVLDGPALDWYNNTVESSNPGSPAWNFSSAILALFERFVSRASASRATEKFYRATYSSSGGVKTFYDDLQKYASRMVQDPGEVAKRRALFFGLPTAIRTALATQRLLHPDTSSLEEIYAGAVAIEHGLRFSTTIQGYSYLPRTTTRPYNPSTTRSRPTATIQTTPVPANRTARTPAATTTQPRPARDHTTRNAAPAPSQPRDITQKTCYACGTPGHVQSDPACPKFGQRTPTRLHASRVTFDLGEDDVLEGDHPSEMAEHLEPPAEEVPQPTEELLDGSQYDDDDHMTPYYYRPEHSPPDEPTIRAFCVESADSLRYARMTPSSDLVTPHSNTDLITPTPRPTHSRDPLAQHLLTALISVNGIDAYALFDSGSNTDIMSPYFAKTARITTTPLTEPISVQLGIKDARTTITHQTITSIQAGGCTDHKHPFDIASLDKYDVVLGTPFMWNNHVVLDIANRCARIRGTIVPCLSLQADTKQREHPPRLDHRNHLITPRPNDFRTLHHSIS